MQSFIKKHITGIIAAILLIAIAILAFLAFAPKQNETITDAVDTSLKLPENTPTESPQETPHPQTPTYESTIPKSSLPSEKYLYEQIICGNGNIRLCSVLQTSTASYIIAETDCKSGDIFAEKPTVGIAKLDSVGNIEKTYSLKNTCEYYYITSCLSNLGIVILTTDKAKSYLYVTVTDYALENTETKIMSYASDAVLYPTDDSFLIFTDNGIENFIIKYTEKALLFSTVCSGEIVDIFEFGDFYRVFYNTSSGYGMSDIDKEDFSSKKDIFVSIATLNCIIPIVENGKQVYMAIESEGSIYARKYYSDMAVKTSERKKIGTANILGHGTDGEYVYLCVNGGINGIITLKSDLSFSYTVNRTETTTSQILDCAFSDGFVLLVTDANKKLALIKTTAENSEITYFDTCDKALMLLFVNGTCAIAYNNSFYEYSAIKILGLAR